MVFWKMVLIVYWKNMSYYGHEKAVGYFDRKMNHPFNAQFQRDNTLLKNSTIQKSYNTIFLPKFKSFSSWKQMLCYDAGGEMNVGRSIGSYTKGSPKTVFVTDRYEFIFSNTWDHFISNNKGCVYFKQNGGLNSWI